MAGLEEPEAADAAELLATAGILESGRPLTFIHPIVRSGIYAELSERRARARSPPRRTSCSPSSRARTSASPSTCWSASPPATAGSSSGWSRPRARRERQGAPESEALFLRRALAEPPPPSDRPALLLELGMAEASAGLAGWPEHLQQAVDAAPDPAAAAEAALVLAHALSGAQRYAEAVDVLDRAAATLGATTLGARASARGRRRDRRVQRPRNRCLPYPLAV